MAPEEIVENAIRAHMQEFPNAKRGATATPGHRYYIGVCNAVRAVGKLHKCRCGTNSLGWAAPEYIATVEDITWSVGYDATSNKISCGPKGYHSDRYGNTPSCASQ